LRPRAALAAARGIERGLGNKHSATLKALAETDDRRAALNYDAHGRGGEAAKALAKANTERREASSSLEELEHALKQARAHVAAAVSVEREAAEGARKAAAKPLVERLADCGQKIDSGFALVREGMLGADEAFAGLRVLGAPVPRDLAIAAHRRQAVDAALAGLRLEQLSAVPPLKRRTFGFFDWRVARECLALDQ
jgi:hypothetical protein